MKRLLISAVLALASSGASADTPILKNTSFEINTVGSNYAYGQVAADWVFSKTWSGVSASGTAWNGTASDGRYFAFLQNTSSIAQTFTTTETADYSFSFDLALRPGYNVGQVVEVSLDGQQLGLYSFNGYGWKNNTASAFNIGAGSHTLTFAGLNPGNARDTSAFLDNIKAVNVSAVPEPETYAMLLAGLGLLGFVVRRRKAVA
ncbi:FxDxF family PEP-CTERM protein [Janthinobacterium agaricidamnosum]|uniref:PEP-CTERM putative exosortase interaction domain protein n=1 Tax=Janthinobacterium agaricidamnosum NBRC 102515 = DSM 9628 TaxID=1349767 RepID=W0V2G8_9BURK|nr:FxDxF family PEP-CTERM protein [Janthinobacterium agaricidamnosum]CDG81543.1 PEP-CTERM putative exosortase interaction domain protein [Janthinobacterium agaricidamnosum NBRC 102515 = DSM 9628]